MGFSTEGFQKIVFVTDQGANMVKAIEKGNRRFNCAAHVLNNILKVSMEADEPMRDLIQNAKAIVSHLKRTRKCRELKKGLKQSMPVRWNSNYIMLKSINDQIADVNRLVTVDAVINIETDEYSDESNDEPDVMNDNSIRPINPGMLTEIVEFLEKCQDCFNDLEQDKVPTFHKIELWKKMLLQECLSTSTDTINIKNIKRVTASAINDRMITNVMHHAAVFLNPRFNKLTMLNEEEREAVIAYVKSTCDRIDCSVVAQPVGKRSRFESFYNAPITDDAYMIDHEISLYTGSAVMANTMDEDLHLLDWWRDNEKHNPKLAKLAKQILNVPASSAASERLFSSAKRIYEERRTSLSAQKLEELIFIHANQIRGQ